jgi:hypothetical protein|tara:strand:+ start:247 stop:489 length:243 start_codon:yes stop_codon:yes gene_type:complete
MSTWQLLINSSNNKNNKEAVDTVNLNTTVFEEAHTYFRLRKNLDSETFNKLFIVKEYIKPSRTMGNVEWWKGEATKLDDF